MRTIITKPYVVQTFSNIIDLWKTQPPFQSPTFYIERRYVESFLYYLKGLTVRDHTDLVPLIEGQIQDAWERSFKDICKILDKNQADGIPIFELMCEKKFILRRHRTAYNRKVPGKSPKGLIRDIWEDYNHWLLAEAFWKGFVASQQPEFRVILSDEPDADISIVLSHVCKPLWGIQAAFDAIEKPVIGKCGDEIGIRPEWSWQNYKEQIARETL